MAWLLLIAAISQPSNASSAIDAEERVCFFPTYAWQDKAGDTWQIRVHGWVFEPAQHSLRQHAFIVATQKLLGITATSESAAIIHDRTAAFFADSEQNKSISIKIGSTDFSAGTSNENGHFEQSISLSVAKINQLRAEGCVSRALNNAGCEALRLNAALDSDDNRLFSGSVQLIPPQGISVISDVDDTIKATEVNNSKKLVENTLLKPWQPVPGMAELYRHWAAEGVVFHYVTASPWQLYEPLSSLISPKGFPVGTWHMKQFRWSDSSAYDMQKSPENFKPAVIEQIVGDFPQRRFILIGDSSQRDPEIYGAIARKYQQQIERILIRQVAGAPMADRRCHEAFAELPRECWQLFRVPEEIKAPIISNAMRNVRAP